ncbi:hypothetical protein ACER0C_002927 [Sarotherodon galilaeus]
MKDWCIVQFSTGGTEIVPSSWINGEKLSWPPYPPRDTFRIHAAVKRRVHPGATWLTYAPVRLLISLALTTPQSSPQPTDSRHHNAPPSFRHLSPLRHNTQTNTALRSPQHEESDVDVFPIDDAGVLPLDLPVHNIKELNNAEAALQSQEANKAMVRRFALIGGTTLEVRVRRVMVYAITNELASVLNWAGKKTKDQTEQKRAFKDTALCRCIFDGLMQQLGANSMSEFVFEQAVQSMAPIRPRSYGWRRTHIIHPHPRNSSPQSLSTWVGGTKKHCANLDDDKTVTRDATFSLVMKQSSGRRVFLSEGERSHHPVSNVNQLERKLNQCTGMFHQHVPDAVPSWFHHQRQPRPPQDLAIDHDDYNDDSERN